MNPFELSSGKGRTSPSKGSKSPKSPKSVRKRKRGQTLSGEANKQRKIATSNNSPSQEEMSQLKPKTSQRASVHTKTASKNNHTPDAITSKYFPQGKGTETSKIEDQATHLQSREMEAIMKRLEEMSSNDKASRIEISSMVKKVDKKLETIQENVERTEKKMDIIEQKVDNTERKIDHADQKIEATMKTLNHFRESLEFTQEEVHNLKEEMKIVKENFKPIETRHCKLSQADTALSMRIQQIEQENKIMNTKFDNQENYSRRENVICEGVPEHMYEDPFEVAHRIFQTLHMRTPPLQRCHRLGPPLKPQLKPASKPRPFIIRLVHFQAKVEMFHMAKNLRGTGIIIKDDFCLNTQRRQNSLKPILTLAKSEDRRAKFVSDKILFRGQLYGLEDIKKMPLDTESASCRMSNGVTVFSGELCPLSNLHPVNIEIDGKPYGSTEHYYQTKKCEHFGNTHLANQIYQAATPREAMELGKAFKPSRDWTETTGAELMTRAVKTKFEQPEMKRFLLATRGAIGEGTKHPFWGVGHSMHTREAMLVNNWNGLNIMGKILTELRENLSKRLNTLPAGEHTAMEYAHTG
jgi:hypothetical protein